MRFSKYHGAGNDFLLVEDLEDRLTLTPDLVTAMCDRYRGVGADGVIRVARSARAPFSMELWNADGGQAEMSGNGMRCVAKFLLDRRLAEGTELDVDTDAGVKRVRVTLQDGEMVSARVDMGPPALERREIPMAAQQQNSNATNPQPGFMTRPFEVHFFVALSLRERIASNRLPMATHAGFPLAEREGYIEASGTPSLSATDAKINPVNVSTVRPSSSTSG